MSPQFRQRLEGLVSDHQALINRPNFADETWTNGLFRRYRHPVLTAAHTPLTWRYDLDEKTNPFLIERQGINAAFNAGAIELGGRFYLVARVEGHDRKSFFAVAQSESPIDGWRFWDYPLTMPEASEPDTNVYDMRLTAHQDGWIYGLFCTERKDKNQPNDLSAATAQCGIARTRDLKTWQRLPDLKSRSPQQRNVVLHPEFVGGKYALYTRPQDDFIQAGSGGGIGWALCDSMENAVIGDEKIIDRRYYHTIKELKNGQGPHPIKTTKGWLHVAHGVRGCAAGYRYVLYAFLSSLEDPSRLTHAPAGYFIAPEGEERIGDVSNVVFSNGMIARKDGSLYIYYASSDTRMHVAETTVEKMVDYCINTPADPLYSAKCVELRKGLIAKNLKLIDEANDPLLKKCCD